MHEVIRDKKGDEDEKKRWVAQIVYSLSVLHDNGVCHKNLKSGNVILSSGTARLTDFGTFKHELKSYWDVIESDQKKTSATENYLPPEYYKDHTIKDFKKADTFSLGIICLEILSGMNFEKTGFYLTGNAKQRKVCLKLLEKGMNLVPEGDMRNAVWHMIRTEPDKRKTPKEILHLYLKETYAQIQEEMLHHDHEEDQEDALPSLQLNLQKFCSIKNEVDIEVPDYFCDPISLEIMHDPVMVPSGHTFDKKTLVDYISQHGQNPLTREQLSEAQLIPNRALREAIEKFKSDHPGVFG